MKCKNVGGCGSDFYMTQNIDLHWKLVVVVMNFSVPYKAHIFFLTNWANVDCQQGLRFIILDWYGCETWFLTLWDKRIQCGRPLCPRWKKWWLLLVKRVYEVRLSLSLYQTSLLLLQLPHFIYILIPIFPLFVLVFHFQALIQPSPPFRPPSVPLYHNSLSFVFVPNRQHNPPSSFPSVAFAMAFVASQLLYVLGISYSLLPSNGAFHINLYKTKVTFAVTQVKV
jgi:hypothetical protein